jgi:hypothetical protein
MMYYSTNETVDYRYTDGQKNFRHSFDGSVILKLFKILITYDILL